MARLKTFSGLRKTPTERINKVEPLSRPALSTTATRPEFQTLPREKTGRPTEQERGLKKLPIRDANFMELVSFHFPSIDSSHRLREGAAVSKNQDQ